MNNINYFFDVEINKSQLANIQNIQNYKKHLNIKDDKVTDDSGESLILLTEAPTNSFQSWMSPESQINGIRETMTMTCLSFSFKESNLFYFNYSILCSF